MVAKGADFLALRIREEADGAPAYRWWRTRLSPGRSSWPASSSRRYPRELYEAVARLLTFIYSLKASGRTSRASTARRTRPASPLLAAR